MIKYIADIYYNNTVSLNMYLLLSSNNIKEKHIDILEKNDSYTRIYVFYLFIEFLMLWIL